MKKLNPLDLLCNILLSSLLAIGVLGCMCHAFPLDVNTRPIWVLIPLFATFCCLCFSVKNGSFLVLGSLLLAGHFLWKNGLAAQTEAFLWRVSHLLNDAFDIGFVIWWTSDDHAGVPTTVFFLALAMVLVGATTWGFSRRRIWPAMVLALPALFSSLALENTPIPLFYFLLALFALGSIAIGSAARYFQTERLPVITLRSTIAVAIALALLLTLMPQESFVSKGMSPVLQDWITAISDRLNPPSQGGSTQVGSKLSYSMKLTQIGPKKDNLSPAFTLRSNYNGYLYLRGRSYEIYDGISWQADPSLVSELRMDEWSYANTKSYQLTLTYDKENPNRQILFLPWHPGHRNLTGGVVENTASRLDFTFSFKIPLNGSWEKLISAQASRYTPSQTADYMRDQGYDPEPYLALPATTKNQAQIILAYLEECYSLQDYVQHIADYVSASAAYDLNTQQMPSGLNDFALWFLNSSETGYCVHFASAAVVLLRAAGVPARYVEGYLFYSQADTDITVTEKRAHAWVEYYVPTLGWMILEATPGDGLPDPLPDIPTEPPTTAPPTTEPPTTVPPTTEPPTTQPPTEPPTTIPPTTMPPSSAPTAPSETTPGISEPAEPIVDLQGLWNGLKILAWCIGVLLSLLGQWKLRLLWLNKQLCLSDPNTQALRRWKHCCWLSKLQKQEPPAQLRKLAIKAKFSQHTISPEELAQFARHRRDSIAWMKQQSPLLRFIYRIVLAIY